MIAILPGSLMADDSAAAILHSTGGVLLNGNLAPPSSAVFPDDLVRTPPNSEATINSGGSTVMVNPDTVVQFEGSELHLDHGTLLVSTSRQLRVRVGCLTVVPLNPAWTQYDVADIDGRVTVAARSSDVNIDARGTRLTQGEKGGRVQRITVREGEQQTREESCAAAPQAPAYVAGKGAILNSPWVKWPAVGAIGVATCWVLCRGDNPISPSGP
jgi:ferric-dicitrate binding protein FerR (iron transport regulator)